MASFFSSLLSSLKVTFFSPARNDASQPTKEQTETMPTFGLSSLDETVDEQSKMEKPGEIAATEGSATTMETDAIPEVATDALASQENGDSPSATAVPIVETSSHEQAVESALDSVLAVVSTTEKLPDVQVCEENAQSNDGIQEVQEIAGSSETSEIIATETTSCDAPPSNDTDHHAVDQATSIVPSLLVLDDNTLPLVEILESTVSLDPNDAVVGIVTESQKFHLSPNNLLSSENTDTSNTPSGSPPMDSDVFFSAKSKAVLDFDDSVEPMDIDTTHVEEYEAAPIEPQDDAPVTHDVAATQLSDECVVSENMSAEDSEPVVASETAISNPASGDLPLEEKPLCGKGSYAIDWDNFDENCVPDPFGGRLSTATKKPRAAVKRSPRKNQAGSETAPPPPPSESESAPPPPELDNKPIGGTVPDKNANEIIAVENESTVKSEQQQPPTNTDATEEDRKNSNVAPSKTMNIETPPNQGPKEAVGRSTTTKPARQQTAVVAPTVHVAAVVGASNELDNAAASASRSDLRRPPIKGNPATSASVQQTVPMPAQNNRRSSPMGNRSGDEISEEEMNAVTTSDPFNDTAAFEYLQQAGKSKGESNLHRQSLYQAFDPLVGGGNPVPVAGGDNQSRRKPQMAAAANTTDDGISLNDITLSDDKDDSLLTGTQSPARDQNRSDDVPPTVVKKKHGPKVQSASNDSLGQGDNADTDRRLSVSPVQGSNSPVAQGASPEIKLQFQALLLAKEKEFLLRLQEERSKAELEISAYKKEAETAKQNASEMSFVVAEYEKTVRQLIADKDKPKPSRSNGEYDVVVKERDQALDDLQTVENAFSELNRRYETLRSSSAEYKKNEEALKKSVVDNQQKAKKWEDKFNKLYSHAEQKLDMANQEIERLIKSKETDMLSLRAMLKKREVQIETLEMNLEQKHKEIQKLMAICDELIEKAGAPS